MAAQGLEWALGSLGLGVGWEKKPISQERRIFSGTQDDGRHAPGKESFPEPAEGGLLREGWEGWIQKEVGRGRALPAEGKSPPSAGCLDWMRQAVALRPWDKGHVAKACGFWAFPTMFSILEGPPAIHPHCPEIACVRPGAQPCCPSPAASLLPTPAFLSSAEQSFSGQRSSYSHCKPFLERQDKPRLKKRNKYQNIKT